MATKKPKWTRHIHSMGAIDSMTRKELSSIVSELSAVANKRLKYLESKGIQYYANDGSEDTISGIRKYAAKGKSLGELRAEYKRVSGFLQSPLSTMTGRKERYYETVQRLANVNEDMRKEYADKTRGQIEREYTQSIGMAYDIFNNVASLFEAMRVGKWLSKGINTKGLDSTQWRQYFEEMSYLHQYEDIDTLINNVKKDLGVEDVVTIPEGVGTSKAF